MEKRKRPLGIPTMYDRAMQALYTLALNHTLKPLLTLHPLDLENTESAQHACATIFNRISRKCDAQWILEGDIKGCFDNISHEWLLDNIPMDNHSKAIPESRLCFKDILFPTNSGTTQGSIISPILSTSHSMELRKYLI